MADVLLLFVAALFVLGATVTAGVITRQGQRKRALERQDRPRRLRQELAATEDYIRQVNQATADEELDRLERHKENN